MLHRYFADELTPSEKKELMKSVEQDTELRKEFCRIQNLRAITSLFPAASDTENATSRLLKWKRNSIRIMSRQVAIYAAAVILVGFALWGLLQPFTRTLPEPPSIYLIEVTSPSNITKSFRLSDGTIVWLNSSSTLRYPNKFAGQERRVELTGEAFFEVAGDPAMPFIVTTDQYDIRVLGTKFNVFAYKDHNVKTSLVEGSLEVINPAVKTTPVRIRPNESIEWEQDGWQRSTFQDKEFLLWKDGIYAFNDVPFIEIVNRLELYYNTTIVVTNQELAQYRFNAKFRQDDGLESILKTMRKIYRFKIDENQMTNTIMIE
ncbi:MAG: FecR domain-containing protein [Bacteroidales bacterium]|nr:FecR domain-containing protein [Bacteroidales bacterium]MDD4167147.1 FecR domain-containing protein [Bacteroidales bacterium]MDD4472685.1 FecR domain-containing protein [Bacteroidales bacterium]MDD5046297.1 FecR domain-containing protein [Bacteroidales bacterium]